MALAEPPVRNVQSESDGEPTRIGTTSLPLGIALSIATGFLAVWSFEDFHVEWLIWVAFVPAIVAQHRVLPARWSGLGLGIAVGIMFQGYLGPGLGGADLAWYLYVYGVWIGIFVAVLAWRSRRFHARTGYRWLPLTAPMVWVALDFLRTGMTEVFAGSWGMVAYAMYDRPALLQPVSITGIHGLNLLILMVNWTLALGVLAALDHRHGPPPDRAAISLVRARRWRIRVAAVIGVWVVVSVALLGQAMGPAVRVAAIQPDPYSPQPRTVDIDQAEELRRDLEQSRHAAELGAELIVWHEAGLEFDPRGADGAPIAAFADAHDVYLAVGWQTPTENGRFNEVASFGPDGEVLGSYGKSHPGEFAGDYSERQGEYLVYETPFGAFGSIICFDLDFLDSARNVARLGARILAVSSNDVAGIAEKHYTHLVFRAIETRLAAVKADSAYDSAIIDPHGRILARHVDKQTSRATVVADVPMGTGDTFYVRYGDWLAWLAVAGTIVLAVFGAFVRRRSVKEPA